MKKESRREFMKAVGSIAALGAMGHPLSALAQPTVETARLLCGFGVGGAIDIVARRLSERMTGDYARSIVVDNRVGAGGRIAIEAAASAKPDGTALLVTPGAMLYIYPHIYKQLRYDPLKDLTPVTLTTLVPMAIAVGPMVPQSIKTLDDFLGWARANPGQANFGSGGAGSMPHFVGVMMEQASGVPLQHVPYKGTQAAISDMLGGQIAAATGPEADFMAHLSTGKVRLLAISGTQRTKFNPEVPTFVEQGMPKLVVQEWFAIFMPPKSSLELVDKVHSSITAALRNPVTTESLTSLGFTAQSSTPAELGERLKADLALWGPIVQSIGFKAD